MKLSAIITLVILAGCSDENSHARGEFLSGCVHSGGTKAVCQCIFRNLEKKYSPTELQQSRWGNLIQDVIEAKNFCSKE
ncbi:hypothetical protein SAMN05216202_5384 [Pseudomonas mucidolens]|uniref:Uncharacterized protein n=1 Tax=Pseudomonas mucidolens TaxID=46679 RepID=A0A1H2P2M6_9PSED|nr:hypothetical protein SAMN05216202_5384 [Pseudomonas mucidolens]